MSEQFNRRKFIKAVTYSGLSLALTPPLISNPIFYKKKNIQLKNNFFSLSFDEDAGRISVLRNDGSLFINNAGVRANLIDKKIIISQSSYSHHIDVKNINDKLGIGKQLIIYSKDSDKKIDFETKYNLYENINCIIIEVSCKNVSNRDLIIKSIEPICATQEINASLMWGAATKVLTNGPMYYDAGMVHAFDTPYKEPDPYGPTKGGILSPDFKYPNGNQVRSWWNVGFFKGYDKEGLVCGYIENNSGLGEIVVSKSLNGISLYTESVFAKATTLRPNQSISSNRFMIIIEDNPYLALEKFADIMGKINNARFNSIVNGWCEWFYTYQFVTEDEVLRNAEFASRYLKPYGFEFIQIDEGYQRYHGDWEGNQRFPSGMKSLADKIKFYGLKPGLWIAPYIVSEPTDVFQKHPDWFLKNSDGSLMRVGPWPSIDSDWAKSEDPKRYCLDITHPDAAKWFFNLFDTIGNKWGYEMIKLDFVAWSVFSADHFYHRSATPAQVYRKGLEIIRSAIGNEKHINDCGPGNVSVGLIDSMRIELDQNYGYSQAAWKQYFLDSSSSAPAAAKRFYYHKRTWINDADHICISLLSIPQAKAAASIIGLSGGNIISGDRLTDLDSSRLEILKKIYPSFGEAAKPVDLFDTDLHSIFALKIKKPFAEWSVIGIFNSNENDELEKTIPLNRLWLDPAKTYLAYDFWMERFFGEINNELNVKVPPATVTLLALHEKRGIPQIISSDRHILQGAVELDDATWDDASNTLLATSNGPLGTFYNVAIYLPNEVNWTQGNQGLYHDFETYTLKLIDPHILRVHLKFDKSEKINWKINFKEMFN